MIDFSSRYQGKEIMDGPEIVPGSFEKAYEDIHRCNVLLGGHKASFKEVKRLIISNKKKSYTIWDLGSGDGSTLRFLQKKLSSHFSNLDYHGFDLSELSVELAKRKSGSFPNIFFHHQDILQMGSSEKPDIIICNLTLHHFTNEDAEDLLISLSKLAKIGVVVNDLERHPMAYYLFKLFSIFFIKTSIARNDGLTSIRRSFRLSEFQEWAKNIPGSVHRIYSQPMFRLVWVLECASNDQLQEKTLL